ERYGPDGVHPRRHQARAGRPVQLAPETERLLLSVAVSAATWGASRIAAYLQHRWQLRVAPRTVQRALRRAGLATRRQPLGERAARRTDGGAAHRADPARPLAEPARTAAACGGPRARRTRVPGHLLHWSAQGRGQGLADHGLRCGLLVRGRLAAARPHCRSGGPLPAPDLAPGVSPRGLAAAPGADRWRARVQGGVR